MREVNASPISPRAIAASGCRCVTFRSRSRKPSSQPRTGAFMLVKAPVLGCDEGFLDLDRNVTQRHPDAAIALGEIGEAFTSRIENPAGLGNTGTLEPTVIGQIGDSAVIEPDHFGKIDGSFVFVLAELPVDCEEALEFQAVEHFDLA